MGPVQKLIFAALALLASPLVAGCMPETPETALDWNVDDSVGRSHVATRQIEGRTIYADAPAPRATPKYNAPRQVARNSGPRTYMYQENLGPLPAAAPAPNYVTRNVPPYNASRVASNTIDPSRQDYTWDSVPGYRRPQRSEPERNTYDRTSYDRSSYQPQGAYNNSGVVFGWPVAGDVISGFGAIENGGKNDGINIAVAMGAPIHAAAAGSVTYAGNELKGYGNLVLLKHAGGFTTAYAHADRLLVSRGDFVAKGQVIGYAGQTGDVTSPQLHFEIRANTTPVNPRSYLSTQSARAS